MTRIKWRRDQNTRLRSGNSSAPRYARVIVLTFLILYGAAYPRPAAAISPSVACTKAGRVLKMGFYALFPPVSYSADTWPEKRGFNEHLGYEADLLTALEAMRGAGLRFSRKGIATWENIWLRPAGPGYDIVGGGISILDSRTRDASGKRRVVFTSGHIVFRQSLLVRAADAGRFVRYGNLRGNVRVGVLAGTTGEARLLEATGLTDASGVIKRGVRIKTPEGVLTADGGPGYIVRASGSSSALRARIRLHAPRDMGFLVVYLDESGGENEWLESLRAGRIDAIASEEIGNRRAAHNSGDAFVVTALDRRTEHGGFALGAADASLAACLDRKIEWLTEKRRIGYAEWLKDPSVFGRRARAWRPEVEHRVLER